MSDSRDTADVPGVFDPATVESVAADHDVDASRLRSVLAAHQRGMADRPGIDDLVYEWRRYLPGDPLVFRSGSAYYVAAEDRVWDQFAVEHDMDEATYAAVRAVHAATFRADAPAEVDADAELADAGVGAMVLEKR